ncbi:MAG: hypothetical protein OJI67_11415 [Prosthecobacter sp.]|nr:hypothetical protein [Prosthecobacter sp.]
MKPIIYPSILALLSMALVSCEPPSAPNNAAADEARQKLEETQAAYEQQAADMQARSAELQQQLADLEKSIKDKENAELQAKLDAIQLENEKLMAEAEAARQKSDELRDQLDAVQTTPTPTPYPQQAPNYNDQPWEDDNADYSMFYEELNPYGQWLEVEGYGYAWQPNLATRSTWRPYVDGRWVWSDHGWAWDTPEPFGWATYHYGRWVQINRRGWVWVPGREWAPAWVSWRSGDDCVGWAPLPPIRRHGFTSIGYECDVNYGLSPSSYIFIEANNFGRSSYVNVCLSLSNITGFFQQTVNVTNIIQINQQQTNIYVNRGGPDRRWLEKRIGRPVPVAPVRVAKTLERPELVKADSDGVRPLIAAPLPSGRGDRPSRGPKAATKIARPAIVDAWSEVPSDRRQSLRDAVSRQAKGPKPTVVNELPETPGRDHEPTPRPEVRPGIPLPGTPATTPDRMADRDRDRRPDNTPRPGMRPGTNDEAAQKAELARREAEAAKSREAAAESMKKAEMDRRQRDEDMLRNRKAQMNQAQELSRQKAEAAKAKQAEEAQQTEMKRRMRDAEAMKAKQEDLVRKQAEAAAMQKQILEQKQRNDELRRQQTEAMKARDAQTAQQAEMVRRQRDAETSRAREAAMAQQQEIARKQAEAAEMQRRQIETQKLEKARENAARQQQEMANRQREAAQRTAQEAAQKRASEEAQRGQPQKSKNRDDDTSRDTRRQR